MTNGSGLLPGLWPTQVPAPRQPLHRPKTQFMGVSTTVLFGGKCPTVATWSFGGKGNRNDKDEEEGVEITIRTKEQEEEAKAEKRGRLCIPRAMQRRILHEAHSTPAGVQFGADRMFLRMKDPYFWKEMWLDTQQYVAGCDWCHRTNDRSGKPMGRLRPLPMAKGLW